MNIQTQPNRLFVLQEDGALAAELLFPATGEDTVCFTRTFVDGSLRGQGAAGQLMEAGVSLLRATGRSATATCSYAQRWLAEHPEHSDILAK